MKYETTRPVSGKPSSTTKARAKSAKAVSNRIFEMTEGEASSGRHLQGKCSVLDEDFSLFDRNHVDHENPPVKANGGHKRYNDKVTEGLRQMENMEEDFIKTTKMLQQKLGITGGGVI